MPDRRRGSVLILASLVLLLLTGVAGLALDTGMLYVVWNHERTLAEAAALAAALKVDATPADQRVRVTRTVEVPLYFMQAFARRSSTTVRVTVVAERVAEGPVRARLVQ